MNLHTQIYTFYYVCACEYHKKQINAKKAYIKKL